MKRKLNSATARKSPCKTSESLSDLKKYWTSTMILLKKNYKYIPPLQGRRGSLLYPDNLRDTILILIFFFGFLYIIQVIKREKRETERWTLNSTTKHMSECLPSLSRIWLSSPKDVGLKFIISQTLLHLFVRFLFVFFLLLSSNFFYWLSEIGNRPAYLT